MFVIRDKARQQVIAHRSAAMVAAAGKWRGIQEMKYPYRLMDGLTGAVVYVYKSLSIALRDCGKKNAEYGDRRYYVLRPNGGKVTA